LNGCAAPQIHQFIDREFRWNVGSREWKRIWNDLGSDETDIRIESRRQIGSGLQGIAGFFNLGKYDANMEFWP
jgi:hypothetical protein